MKSSKRGKRNVVRQTLAYQVESLRDVLCTLVDLNDNLSYDDVISPAFNPHCGKINKYSPEFSIGCLSVIQGVVVDL